ncbi:MAG: hypothetical protein HY360_18830 [Verrucomicrobia bacterium]|nr:hypothetical protein [Verrucomicrobiota bacterium]
MNIISFNEAKQVNLLEKAEIARGKRQFREAYDFLREALRYGENAAIFNRAAAILNEMGEFTGALQVAQYALKCEGANPQAKWEMAVAAERLWKLDLAARLVEELPEEGAPDPFAPHFPRRNELWGMICLKRLHLPGVRKAIFRGAVHGRLPEPLASRAERLAALMADRSSSITDPLAPESASPPGLREWIHVMYRRRLLKVGSVKNGFSLHIFPGQEGAAEFNGEHFVMGHPSFRDCGRILLELHRVITEENRGYGGVYPCHPASASVAIALSRILKIPLVEPVRLSAAAPILLCMASNLGGGAAAVSRRWPARHDLFILGKSFEHDEFYDVVAPPHNRPMLSAWAEPILSDHRQIIGALGEYITLPWEQASIKAYQSVRQNDGADGSSSVLDFNDDPRGRPSRPEETSSSERIADRLVAAYQEGANRSES